MLDSYRDQRNEVLISVVQLGYLFGQKDAATSSLAASPSAGRARELSYADVQIAQRLAYLRRQGMTRSGIDALQAAFARFQADAQSAGAASRASGLTQDAAAINSLINRYERSYKASYARWDSALDATTVAVIVAAALSVLALFVRPRHQAAPSGGGTKDSGPGSGPPDR